MTQKWKINCLLLRTTLYAEINKTNHAYKFLCKLFYNVGVVHAPLMIFERAFDPQAWLFIQLQIIIAPTCSNSHFISHCMMMFFNFSQQYRQCAQSRLRISMTPLNCPPLRTRSLVQDSRLYVSDTNWVTVIVNFVSKWLHLRYHGNKGRSEVNFNETVDSASTISLKESDILAIRSPFVWFWTSWLSLCGPLKNRKSLALNQQSISGLVEKYSITYSHAVTLA